VQLGLIEAFRPLSDNAECLVESAESLVNVVRSLAPFGDQGQETRLPEPGSGCPEISQSLTHLHDALLGLPSALDH
jgi:hypothetical protein